MNRTIRVSAAGDILIMKRLLPGYQDVLPIRELMDYSYEGLASTICELKKRTWRMPEQEKIFMKHRVLPFWTQRRDRLR